MKKLTLIDILAFMPKNGIVCNEAFRNEKTGTTGLLVSTLLNNEKYKDFLKLQITGFHSVSYKRVSAIAVDFAVAKSITKETSKK